MVVFNGTLKVVVLEATDLRPTNFATRHNVGSMGAGKMIDPYVSGKDISRIKTGCTAMSHFGGTARLLVITEGRDNGQIQIRL